MASWTLERVYQRGGASAGVKPIFGPAAWTETLVGLDLGPWHLPSVLWTDSTTVLRYINNETTRYQLFVANRLAATHDGSRKEQWRYVPSSMNAADMVSRGVLHNRDM